MEQSCRTIEKILVKTIIEAEGLDILNVHHKYYTPFLEMIIGYSNFKHKMFYDHDIMEGSFGNVWIYELTNHPKTIIPAIAEKGSLYKLD